jgi:hypothetical protein
MTLTQATLTFMAPTAVLIAIGILICRQIATLRRRAGLPLEWTPELSVDRYRPMFRLLEEDDVRFLRAQPGATPDLIKRLRRGRYQVFRGYLLSLERDFHRGFQALMLALVQSPSDRRDVIRAPIVSRMRFGIGIFRLRCRVFLYRWNVGHQSVAPLVNLFERLQSELLAVIPATATLPLS